MDLPLCKHNYGVCYTIGSARLIHDALLESSPCLNQLLPQLDHIPDWCTVHRLMYHISDAVIHLTYR